MTLAEWHAYNPENNYVQLLSLPHAENFIPGMQDSVNHLGSVAWQQRIPAEIQGYSHI